MAKKSGLLDSIEDARRKTLAHKEDGVWRVESRQDCEHIVAAAKVLADTPPGKDFRLIGFIPDAVLNQAFIEGWIGDKARIRQWLRDNPDMQVHKA